MFKNFIRILSLVLIVSLLWNMLPLSVLGEEFRAAQSENSESTSTEADATLETQEPEEITILGELTDRRTENIKEYLLSNGNTLAAVYGNSVHYQEDGQWKEIDNTLIAKNGTYVNTAGLLSVSFPQSLTGNNYITVTRDGYTLSFGMAGQLYNNSEVVAYGAGGRALSNTDTAEALSVSTAKTALAQLHTVDFAETKAAAKYPELVQEKLSSRLSYSNVYDNTNITYDLDSNRVKESVILSRYDAALRGYRYTLRTGDMIPVLAEDGHIDFYDPQQEEIILTMPAPFLVDADLVYNWDIEVSLTGSNGTYTLTYLLPQSWLAAEGRAWPVVLDPEVNVEASATTIADQTVFSGGSEYYTWDYLQCGRDTSRGISRFFLKFKALPDLSSADMIVNAEVSLYKPNASADPFYVGVHGVTEPWESSSIVWSDVENEEENYKIFDANTVDYRLVRNTATYYWNITDIARQWYQSGNNYGMMFKASDTVEEQTGTNNYVQFYSSDYETNDPQLTIEYRNTTGLEDYWDYTSASAGRAGTAYVNNSAGNLVFVRNLMAFGGNLMPVSIDLVYNASDKDISSYGVGRGWRTNYNQRIYPFGADYYVWEDADGTRHYFRYNATKGAYYDEDNLDLVITEDYTVDNIVMTDLAGNTSTFEMTGRLIKIQNNQETSSSIDIEYVGDTNRISQITDGVGRKYVFTYTNNLLTRISYKATGTTELHYVTLEYTSGDLTKITDRDGAFSEYEYSTSGKLLTKASDPQGIGLSFTYFSTAENGANRISKITEIDDSVSGNFIQFSYGNKRTTLTDNQGNIQHMQFNTYGNTINIQNDKGVAAFAEYAAGQRHQLTLSSDLQGSNVNWLTNGSFEGAGGYSVAGAWESEVLTSTYDSGKMLSVIMPNNAAGRVSFNAITIAAGESCTISAYVNLYAGEATLQLLSGSTVRGESVKLTTVNQSQWIRLSASYTNNTNGQLTLSPRLHLAKLSDVYIDGVQLEKASSPGRLNLLQNSDFTVAKTNTNYGWTESNLSSEDGRVDITNSAAPTMDGNVIELTGNYETKKRITQRIDLSGSKNDVLTIAGWGKGYVPTNETIYYGPRQFGIELTFHDSGGIMKGYTTLHFNPNTDGWQYIAGQVKATGAYSYVVVTLLCDFNVGTVYFDGIQLSKGGLGNKYTYNNNGDIATITNSKGQTATFNYTNRDLRSVVNFDGSIVEYTYDAYKNITQEVTTYLSDDVDGDPVEYTATYTYDTYGNVLSTTATGVGTTNITYTDKGNYIKTYTDAQGNLTSYYYELETGVLESVVYPQKDPTEDLQARTVSYEYDDGLFRPTRVSQGSGSNARSIEYCYESDYLTGLTTGSTNYSFTYGSFGDTQQVSAGTNLLATYGYTGRNLTSLLYSNGAEITYVYDNEGRVIEEHYPGNTEDIVVKYGYDSLGRLISVTDGLANRTTNYSYDADGNLLCAETKGNGLKLQTVRYRYDAYDQLIGKESSLRTETTSSVEMTPVEASYTYNEQHLPEQITVGNVRQNALYDNAGMLSKLDTGASNTTTAVKSDMYYYGDGSLLTRHTIAFPRNYSNYYEYNYSYDNRGNISEIKKSDELVIKYTYDSANQLIREDNKLTGETWLMTYDDAGNMTKREAYQHTEASVPTSKIPEWSKEFTYSSEGWGDVLTGINGVGVQSDEIGNITNDGTWTYTWKNGRQLASMENDIEEWVFSYDASGMRTARTDGIVTYNYTYEGTQLVQMTYAGYALIFTYGINGHPMTVNFNGVDYYYMTNALGDVIGILDGNGNEVVTYIYDAWGNCIFGNNSEGFELSYLNPLRYRGYVYDQETKLYYLQSRYYNPDICRFISADSISYLGADGTIQSYNLFAYCNNNPVMYYDPSGHAVDTIFDVVSLATSLLDVCTNPLDPWAWAGLVGDVIDLGVPFLTGVGETVKASKTTVRVITKVDDVVDAAKTFQKVTDAADDIQDAVGTYVILYKSMNNYVGKGPFSRAIVSAGQHLTNADEVLAIIWAPTYSDKTAFIAEYLLQTVRQVGKNLPGTFNKIWSPGRRLF